MATLNEPDTTTSLPGADDSVPQEGATAATEPVASQGVDAAEPSSAPATATPAEAADNDDLGTFPDLLFEKAADFDLSALSDDCRETVRTASERIRDKLQATQSSIIEIGRELLTIKKNLKHGQFGPFLRAEFGWSARHAQRLMNAARFFGDKTDIVSQMPMTAIYKYSAPSTSQAVRDVMMSDFEAGESTSATEVKTGVRKGRAAPRANRAAQVSESDSRSRELERGREWTAAQSAADLLVQNLTIEQRTTLLAKLDRTTPKALMQALRYAADSKREGGETVAEVP